MNDLENLVPSRELCKLIPAREFEDSYFVWAKFDKWVILLRNCVKKNKAYITEPIIYPAPTLQEIMEAIGGIKEISYPDELNPGRTLCRDPRFEPSIEYFPNGNGNLSWISMRWTTSIWKEKETSATAAALRTYLSIKKVEVTMPCPECGTWMHSPDDEHPEYESMDDFKIKISEFCPECGFKFYDEPFLYILKPAKKYLLWIDTPMGSRWIKNKKPVRSEEEMNKIVCDICGDEFVWKKGMAYCSYDCQEKARQKSKQQAQEHWEKIENNTQCPVCGFVGVHIERWCDDDHGLLWETFYKCKKCGRIARDHSWDKQSAPSETSDPSDK